MAFSSSLFSNFSLCGWPSLLIVIQSKITNLFFCFRAKLIWHLTNCFHISNVLCCFVFLGLAELNVMQDPYCLLFWTSLIILASEDFLSTGHGTDYEIYEIYTLVILMMEKKTFLCCFLAFLLSRLTL